MVDWYDVVVVGGGPAGSSAALAAADAGASVLVLEREPEIATTVRTSGVTWMETVREFGIPRSCYNPVRNYGFCSPNNQVVVRDTKYGAAVLDVRATYRWLAEQARRAGSRICTGVTVRGAAREGSGICVRGTGPEGDVWVGGRVVVDASGFGGVVARSLGVVGAWKRFGLGAEYEMRAETVCRDTWWLMVGERYSPAGYAWIFPTGDDAVRVGVGVGKPECARDPREILDRIVRDRTGPVGDLGETHVLEYHRGFIPNDGIGRRSVHDGLILVGDSAGQANPLVLEGIRYAIRFGRMAGEVAASAARSGDTSAEGLKPYEVRWRKAAESRISAAYRVQKRWLGLSDHMWDRELDTIRCLAADEFLDFVKADFGFSRMARLAARHPRLAVRQLFGLARLSG